MGHDVESVDGAYLQNITVNHVSWKALNVEVYDKSISGNKTILSDVYGQVNAGMGSHRHFISFTLENRTSVPLEMLPMSQQQLDCLFHQVKRY